MNECVQIKPIKDYSWMWWVLMCGAMLIISLLFGSIPLLVSCRKIMSR